MIITCPHCQTKYQVTYEAIGSAGRKVQCAHCQQAWQQRPIDKLEATPEHKKAFEAIAEDALDEVMQAEEKAVSAELARRLASEKAAIEETRKAESAASGKVDAAVIRKRQKAFTQRKSAIEAELPLARLRRSMRYLGLLLLVGVVSTAYFGRMQVVEHFPAMAGVYEAVGLGVNVVGLEFSNVTTLRTLREGKEVLLVSAQLVGVAAAPVAVPAVVVTLLDSHGTGLYEWSVTPSVRDLMAGERSTFDTQLTMPPGDATSVRLSFAGGETTSLAEGTVAGGTAEAPAAEAVETPHSPAPAEPSEHPIPEQH